MHIILNQAYRLKENIKKLDDAMMNAGKFEIDLDRLSSNMGTNWSDLINLLKDPLGTHINNF